MIAFGIASLFFAILGVLVPIFGIFISGISGFLAWFSPGKGMPLGGAAVVINLINIIFLSPGYMLVVGLETHQRTPDQRTAFAIWMFILFIQISAIVVFLVNFAQYKIDFHTLRRAFVKENPKKDSPRREREIEQPNYGHVTDEIQLQPSQIPDANGSHLAKTLIYKIRGGKKPDSNFWKSEFKNNSQNLVEISLDGSTPHRSFLSEKNAYLKIVSAVISCACLAFLLVYLRPDLFPFLSYSNVFKIFSKTFPENYLDRYKTQLTIASNAANNGNKVENMTPLPSENYQMPGMQTAKSQGSVIPAAIEEQKEMPPTARNFWYVIELKSGETIITKTALESDGVIAALAYDGKEKKFRRSDVKSVTKTTF